MSQLFNEVERRTVAQSIVEQVKELIQQGKLQAGQRLPSERELAEQLKVGRPAVREATSAMLALGIIEIRPGEGAFIRQDFPQSMLKSVDWSSLVLNQQTSDLFEARSAIEVTAARLAAQRATTEERQALRELVDRMAAAASLEDFVTLDLEFHLRLAQASQNVIFADIIDGIQHLMRSSMLRVLQADEMRKLSLQQHYDLCDAIDRGDAAEAEGIMRAHLRKDIASLRGSGVQSA